MRSLRVIIALGLIGLLGRSLDAQTMLQIKPRTGDTLRMRLDQESEISGVRKTTSGESSAMVLTTMKMFSRAIIENNTDKGTVVLAVTDSVLLTTSDEHSRGAASIAEAQMRGQRARFRVTPDGTVGTVDDGDATREVAQVVSLMPATFPKSAIKIGESWIREMPLPAGLQLGAQLSGKLSVTFKLDSITHGGDWAYVSMRGDMQPATGPGSASGAVLERGLVNGTMLVDRKRGWLTESWFNIVVNSLQTFNPAKGILSMRMQTRITQHMHTFERK
ncbi:MAG TPA: hypothetical protein VGM82_05620 [Gemmatimonadaceae bacterium]|jgi:hypothetical protein